MQKYIARRLLLILPTLVILSIAVFALVRFLPGDVVDLMLDENPAYADDVEKLREKLGLTRPIHIQYFVWIGDIFKGDLGESLLTRRTVVTEIRNRFPVTIELALLTILVSAISGISIGVLAAVRQDSFLDYFLRSFSIFNLSVPYFWVSILVLVFFSQWLHWAPNPFYIHFTDDPIGNLKQMAVPSLILGFNLGAPVARMTRATMLDVLSQDYIRTAMAKGLRYRVVIDRHALKNAMIPVLTVIGLQINFAVGGSAIIENIWNFPGLGRFIITVINQRDYPMLQMIVVFEALFVVGMNLIIDLSYAWLDPRIRYA